MVTGAGMLFSHQRSRQGIQRSEAAASMHAMRQQKFPNNGHGKRAEGRTNFTLLLWISSCWYRKWIYEIQDRQFQVFLGVYFT